MSVACVQLQLVGAGVDCTAFNCVNLGFCYPLQGIEEVRVSELVPNDFAQGSWLSG
jgi:hypothetical protein